MTIPEDGVALIHSKDIGPRYVESFRGVVLVIHRAAVSPHERKLLAGSSNNSFQSSWSRLLYAYLENLDEETLRVVQSNEADWSLVKHQIMALLRRMLREQLRVGHIYNRSPANRESAKPHAERLFGEICAWVKANLANPEMSLGFVASHFHVSSRSIQNLFSNFGENITFVSFLRQQRLLQAREMLADVSHANQTISEICWSCGFSDPVYFGKVFREFFGIAPGEMRRERVLSEKRLYENVAWNVSQC